MGRPTGINVRRVIAAAAVTATVAIIAPASALADYTSDYNTAYSLGLQAYTYGEPLIDMQRVFETAQRHRSGRPR